MRKEAKPRLLKRKDVDLKVGAFTGELLHSVTGMPKMCDVCGKERAMWVHNTRSRTDTKKVYLCFGCGDH